MNYEPVPDAAAVLAHLDRMEETARQRDERLAQLRFQMEWQLAVESLGLSLKDVRTFKVEAQPLADAINKERKFKKGKKPLWYTRLGVGPRHSRGRLSHWELTSTDVMNWLCWEARPTVYTHAIMEDDSVVALPHPIVKVFVP